VAVILVKILLLKQLGTILFKAKNGCRVCFTRSFAESGQNKASYAVLSGIEVEVLKDGCAVSLRV
jgi:hypothetical protein